MTVLCECGCGNPAPIATRNRYERGQIKGQPLRFISGHNGGKPLEDRFWNKVVPTGFCWYWSGAVTAAGYGLVRGTEGKGVFAHRVSYEFLVGKIPDGLEIDHLCRNTLCVNPDHLEPVTGAENRRRATAIKLLAGCRKGHPWTAENTRFRRGLRECRECGRLRYHRNKERK